MSYPARHAFNLREELGISNGKPIGEIIDLIVNACKYNYEEESFGNAFSAYTQSLGNNEYLICFNTDHDWGEPFKRFTLSHELGHLSIPEHRNILENQKPHRSKSEYSSNDPIEKEADIFAINFLAPNASFSKIAGMKIFSPDDISTISEHFGISRYAGARRFLELTDLCCTMMVCDEHGRVEYEIRSDSMKQSYRHSYIYDVIAPETALLHDWLSGNQTVNTAQISLNDWLPGLPLQIGASESIIKLNYNKKYLVLITPDISDISTLVAEEDF